MIDSNVTCSTEGYKLGRVEVKSIGMEAIELPADLMEKRERMVGGGPG